MTRTVAVALLLMPGVAHAWSHTGEVLLPEDRPLRWSVEVDPQVPGMTPEQVLSDLQAAVAAWDAAACGVSTEFVGEVAYGDPTEVPEGELHLTFAPLGDSTGAWIRLGAAPSREPVFSRDGRVYTRLLPGAWVVNTDLDFASDDAIEGGECANALSFSSVMGILIGDRLGAGFSYDGSSLMSGRISECEIRRPGPDDSESVDALYGPWAGFECDNPNDPLELADEVSGVVPFDLTCRLVADDQSTLESATWQWGDGETSEGIEVTHTYTREDNYGVRISLEGSHPTCGDFDQRLERFNFVRACGAPQPSFRAERKKGLEYRLVNDSDVSTYGCHTNVRWSVFDEDDVQIEDLGVWEPLVEFPRNGVYRVELALEGPGGETVFEDTVDTREGSVRGYKLGMGCTHAPVGAPLGLLFAGRATLVVRRRRA